MQRECVTGSFVLSFFLSRWHNDWKFLHTSASGMTRENAATKQFNPRRISTCRERKRERLGYRRKLAWQQQQQPTTTTRADNASLSLSSKTKDVPLHFLDWDFNSTAADCLGCQAEFRLETITKNRILLKLSRTIGGSVLSHLWEPDSYTQHSKRSKQLFSFFQSGKFSRVYPIRFLWFFLIKEKMHDILLDKKVMPQHRGKTCRHFCFFPFWRRVSNSFSRVRFGRNRRRRRRTQIIRFCQITRENQKEKMSKGK